MHKSKDMRNFISFGVFKTAVFVDYTEFCDTPEHSKALLVFIDAEGSLRFEASTVLDGDLKIIDLEM